MTLLNIKRFPFVYYFKAKSGLFSVPMQYLFANKDVQKTIESNQFTVEFGELEVGFENTGERQNVMMLQQQLEVIFQIISLHEFLKGH